MFAMLSVKKVIIVATGFGLSSVYFYKKHQYEKEMFDQLIYISENNIKLSGVRLQQRRPFGNLFFLKFIQWSLPYHQSLRMVMPNGVIRHVGLAKSSGSFFDFMSEFVLHSGGNYDAYLNDLESSIPIEIWVEYKRKFGHFPSNIDVEELAKITMTKSEAKTPEEIKQIYKIPFGKPNRDANNDLIFNSCRSAVMYAIRREEEKRTQKANNLLE